MRTSVMLDEKERKAIDSYERGVSMSSLFRCLLMSTVTTEKQWKELVKKEPDLQKAADSINKKLREVGKRSIVL